MAVIAEQSVGSILYQLVDDIPTHVAPMGSVAIDSNGRIFRNMTGLANGWASMFSTQLINAGYNNNTTDTNSAQNSWVNDDASGWASSHLSGFTLATGRLTPDASTSGIFLCTSSTTLESNGRDYSIEVGIAKNNIAPQQPQGSTTFDVNNYTENVSCVQYEYLNGAIGDFINFGKRWTAKGGGNSPLWCVSDNRISLVKVANAYEQYLINETWETGSMSNWTVVNGTQTNKWAIGTVEKNSGTYGVYVSNDNGVTSNYTITSASVVHFYRDITFPTHANWFQLKFYWRCNGENSTGQDQYDYGRVFLTNTSTVPTAGAQLNFADKIGLTKYNNQSTFIQEVITLAGVAGQTKRLVFSWRNDTSLGTMPGFCVDNIELIALI